MSARLEVPVSSTPRTWRARIFVTASDKRLRLPRDLIAAGHSLHFSDVIPKETCCYLHPLRLTEPSVNWGLPWAYSTKFQSRLTTKLPMTTKFSRSLILLLLIRQLGGQISPGSGWVPAPDFSPGERAFKPA